MSATLELHASAVVAAGTCVLIRGPSGAGKSSLALSLIDEARARGHYAALVADDRVILEFAHRRLVARGVRGFEGLAESRGEGLLRLPHEPAAVVTLLVDLGAPGTRPARYPEETSRSVNLLGVTLPRLEPDLAAGVIHAARVTLRRLGIAPTEWPE